MFFCGIHREYFSKRDYICKRSLVLKCVVSASNEFVDIDLQIRLSGKYPETLCVKYTVEKKTIYNGNKGHSGIPRTGKFYSDRSTNSLLVKTMWL